MGLQQLLSSINSNLGGKNRDQEIENLMTELRGVLSKVQDYRESCMQAARRGSRKREMDKITEAIKTGDLHSLFQLVNDMLPLFTKCSQCLDDLENKCKNVRQNLKSAAERYDANKKSAEEGRVGSAIAVISGAGIAVAGVVITPFLPPAGLIVVAAGAATAAGGGIGIAVHSDRLNAAQRSLCKVESLSEDIQSVKRRVNGINTTMNECEDKIKSANRSGECAQQKKRVSRATWHKIKRSLDSMCAKFEEILQQL